MTQIPKKEYGKYLKFLDHNKQYVGLSDWEIILAEKTTPMNDLASVEPNILEKSLKVELSTELLLKDERNKANVLFHELLHARVNIMQKKIEEYQDIEEEHMVNDIVRGFEKCRGIKFK